MPICDNCQTAAYDLDPHYLNQLPKDIASETMNTVAIEMGAELSDHLCETAQEPDCATQCDCSCRPDTFKARA